MSENFFCKMETHAVATIKLISIVLLTARREEIVARMLESQLDVVQAAGINILETTVVVPELLLCSRMSIRRIPLFIQSALRPQSLVFLLNENINILTWHVVREIIWIILCLIITFFLFVFPLSAHKLIKRHCF